MLLENIGKEKFAFQTHFNVVAANRCFFFLSLKPGDGMKSSTSYVTSSVLVGLLNQEGGSCHNLINVISLAKESGITVRNLEHFT